MRVPMSWLAEFVDLDVSAEELAEVLTLGGLEVEAIARPTAGAEGVRIAEVRALAPVPGSDKLHRAEVTDGTDTLEVVAGASNFAVGDRVAWAKPGSVLPGGFAIGRRKLMGITSNGMLASARELAVGDDHQGIWRLDPDAPLGADAAQWLGLDDPVLVLDVTPDRGYGLSLHGLARDVAALTGATLHLPEPVAPTGDPGVPVRIEDVGRCRRFDARRIAGVRVGPSPAQLQRRLAAAGMRPVSNVVDATNAVMLETGNPIHAYDLALLAGPEIVVRCAHRGERMTTLDGVDRALDPDDLLICDADGPVGLAGVMGGERTEINDATTEVLLEVANFSARTVLRTARRHGLHTEGSKRWEREVPPEQAQLAASRCAALITEVAGGSVTGGADHYPGRQARPVIRLRTDRTRSRLGLDLDDATQGDLLTRIGCTVRSVEGDLAVTPPAYRPDLTGEADLQEEVARVYGYDRVPSRVPSTGQVGRRTPSHEARRAVRRALAGGGWTEVMPFPFIGPDDLDALGLAAEDRRRAAIALRNPLSQEESVLRTSMVPTMLRVVRHNVNRQHHDLAFFEVGRVYLPPTGQEPGADGGPAGVTLPAEPEMLGLAACGAARAGRHDEPARPADVYDLLGAADLARRATGRSALQAEPTSELPWHPGRAARLSLDGVDVGVVGELHPRVAEAFAVPPRTLVGELRLAPLIDGGLQAARAAVPSTRPPIRFDVAVVVTEDTPAAAVDAAVRAGAGPACAACELFDVYRGDVLGQGAKSLAYRVRLEDTGEPFDDAEEAAAIERIATAVDRAVGGVLRR